MPSELYVLKLLIFKNIKSHLRLWKQIVLEQFVIFFALLIFLNVYRSLDINAYTRENKDVIRYIDDIDLERFSIEV